MPLYDFKCPVCKSVQEDILCLHSEIDEHCPQCCGMPMTVKIGIPGKPKIWNMNPATQTGEENARMCGVDI